MSKKTSHINTTGTSKTKIIFGLYGAGGFAREVMPFLSQYVSKLYQSHKGALLKLYFVEQNPTVQEINGYHLISEQDFLEIECDYRLFNIAISDFKIRERIATACLARGSKALSIQSPNSINYGNNEIGDGAILCAHTTITSNIKIGKFFHANIYSYVAHDCVIGDYVTFAPNVHCNGNVHIQDNVYIGTGAIIKNGTASNPLVIGEGATIGMGAVVTKNVPPFSTVVGNPAKPILVQATCSPS